MSPFPTKRRKSAAAALLCPLLLAAALPGHAQEGTAPVVTVVTPEKRDMIATVPVSGTLVPRQEVLVYPEISGFPIVSLLADAGDRVEKGDVLAQIEQDQLEARVLQARAEEARAEAQARQAESQIDAARSAYQRAAASLERQQKLRKSGTVSEAALDDAEAAANQAEADLQSARNGLAVAQAAAEAARSKRHTASLDLDHATVEAPVDGLILQRPGFQGAIASAGSDPLFRIARGGEIELEAEVIETDLARVEPGQKATLDVAGTGRISGSVRLVSPHVNPRSRLGTVNIELEGPSLRTGVFASGSIVTDRRNALALPVTAILTDENGSFVFVVKDGKLSHRTVTTGIIDQDMREIVSGVTAQDLVVAKAGAFYREGDTVRTRRVEGTASDASADTARDVAPAAGGTSGGGTGAGPGGGR